MSNVSSSNSQGVRVPKLRFPGFEGEWEVSSFSEMFSFLSNNTLSRAELSDKGKIKNIHYGDVLIKFGDVIDANNTSIPFIGSETALKKNTDYLQTGDVIIADTAEDDTVGKATEILNENCIPVVSGLHTIPCRPNLAFVSSYLGYYFNSKSFHEQLYPFMQGIKVTSISKANLGKTLISYPEPVEQGKISGLLNLITERIEKQRQLVELLKSYKRGVIQSVFSESSYSGKSAKKWTEKTIAEIFDCIIDKGHPEADVLTIIQGFGTTRRDTGNRRISYDKSSVASYKKVILNDFILHLRSFEGGLEIANETGIVSPAYTILRSKYCISPQFYYAYFRSYAFINGKLRIAVEGIRDGKSINMNTFWKIVIPFPPLEEQERFAKIFAGLDTAINQANIMLDKLDFLKRGLLDKLFI